MQYHQKIICHLADLSCQQFRELNGHHLSHLKAHGFQDIRRLVHLSPSQYQRCLYPNTNQVGRIIDWINQSPKHHLIFVGDDDYPSMLLDLHQPPLALYVKGQSSLLGSIQVGMVGSRNASRYGLEQAQQLSCQLAKHGVTVTSGMAMGIDAHAHRGCIHAKKPTLAVLGLDIETIYPHQNHTLYNYMACQGVLVSEHPLGQAYHAGVFPKRNRIIAALSKVLMVIEATQKSGAIITAKHALELNREVMALPGHRGHPQTEGTHNLIQQGAHIITSIMDVLSLIKI